ncbi:MAG: hypothetical protein AB7N76_29505 [Planctomycetota bacterium]
MVLRAPEKDRPAGAGELAQELDRFLPGEPVEARRAGALRRLGHHLRRHRLVVALAGAMLVSLGVILVLLRQNWELRHPTTPPPSPGGRLDSSGVAERSSATASAKGPP